MKLTFDIKPYGSYDVVVCGAGASGTCAAIAAGRMGAKTLLVERSFAVGGMLTIGNAGITKFTEHCKDVNKYKSEVLDVLEEAPERVQVAGGIPKEFVMRMIKNGTALGTHGEAGSYVFTDRIEAQWTLMEMLREAGVEVLYDTRICDVTKDGDKVTGVVVHSKEGFLHIEAGCVIDATGDADAAYYAGVPFNKGATASDVEEGGAEAVGQLQQMGTMYRVRGVDFEKLFGWLKENPERFFQHEFGVMSLDNVIESYNNGEMCVFRVLVSTPDGLSPVQVYNLPAKDEAILLGMASEIYDEDGCDARSLSRAQYKMYVGVHEVNKWLTQVPGLDNITPLFIPDIGVRETRHIEGEYKLTVLDVLRGSDFEDSIGCGGHPVDIHPMPPEVENMDMNHWRFHIPYRIMVPQKIDNLLVTGRCVSATRTATGAIRPTVQCMVMGEMAGTAAALAVKESLSPRSVDVKQLRRVLTENGAVL
ncbi:MAG: FAD-dependent oxidoreductase [Clostridia bacterium]|nr:FAD-dependent oxidoreductase [Clostridia bacterium]